MMMTVVVVVDWRGMSMQKQRREPFKQDLVLLNSFLVNLPHFLEYVWCVHYRAGHVNAASSSWYTMMIIMMRLMTMITIIRWWWPYDDITHLTLANFCGVRVHTASVFLVNKKSQSISYCSIKLPVGRDESPSVNKNKRQQSCHKKVDCSVRWWFL